MDDTDRPRSAPTDEVSSETPRADRLGPVTSLTERECWELLRREVVGRLAVVHHDAPDIFPVNHLVDHGSVVIRTAAGTKLAAAAGRPVAFEVDGHDPATGAAWSVVLRGTARKILEREETLAALRLPLVPWQEGRKAWFLRLEPVEVTGRRIVVASGAREALHREAGH